jgi:hypothetical protein
MNIGRKLAKWLVKRVSQNDPWRHFQTTLPAGAFGGSERTPLRALDFRSAANISALSDVCNWLASCKKNERVDPRFQNADLASLAEALENEREGNCKAHAAWAFGQLARLGYNPTLLIGRLSDSSGEAYHAWVVFEEGGRQVLLETMADDPALMLRELHEAKAAYIPRFGGDAQGTTFVFTDQLHAQLEQQG